MLRRNREIVIFNLSAIDLFCSGMGAVMVLMVLLMPYYRKTDPVPTPEPPTPVVVAPPIPIPDPPKPEPPEPEKGLRVHAIDVVFVVDATASMEDELIAVQGGMTTIVQVLRRLCDDVQVGFVAYIDHGSTSVIPLKSVAHDRVGDENLRRLLRGISAVELDDGKDWPEDVCDGLEKASVMGWTVGAKDRRQIVVLIGDARTHPEDHDRSLMVVGKWVGASPNRTVNAVHTGVDDPRIREEYLAAKRYFHEVAKTGKGQYFEGQGDLLGSILDVLIVR